MKPVISLHGNGEDVVLSNRAARFVLMRGATGLGWSPRDLTVADLASGGGVLRHVRATTPKVMIPLLLGGGYGERREDRRRLERLCDGRVEIRVVHPDGQARSRFGWLESGLQGDYGAGEDAPDGQKLALTFVCPDPLWYGVVRDAVVRVAAARKAFLTGATPLERRRNLHQNPRGAYGLDGFRAGAAVFGRAGVTLSESSGVVSTVSQAGVVPTTQVETPSKLPEGVYMCSATVTPGPGVTHVNMEGSDWVRVRPESPVRVSALITNPPRGVFNVSFHTGGQSDPVPEGTYITISDVLIEETDTLGEFFDGDTPGTDDASYWWDGEPGRSQSVEDARGASHAYPFFPVLLSDSTVQGAHVLTIQGDAEAWPVWEVTGPGEDLLIQNDDTGERIFIEGKFEETVTITTQPQIQDISSEYELPGVLWSRVSEDSVLFPLQPGVNRVRVSMVGAKPESQVRMRYREAFKAGM